MEGAEVERRGGATARRAIDPIRLSTDGRNRHDPFAILTIPTTILHDPLKILHMGVAIPVKVVASVGETSTIPWRS